MQGPANKAARDEEFEEEPEAPAALDEAFEHCMLNTFPAFSNQSAGAVDAAYMLLGTVVDLKAHPTQADVTAVHDFVQQQQDVRGAIFLAAALDSLHQPIAGMAEMRAAAEEICGDKVNLEAQVAVILKKTETEADIGEDTWQLDWEEEEDDA